MILFRDDYRILAALAEDGGFTTRHVTVQLRGNGNLRRENALMYRRLYSLSAAGFVREMDSEKPICWVRTKDGTAKLVAHQQREHP